MFSCSMLGRSMFSRSTILKTRVVITINLNLTNSSANFGRNGFVKSTPDGMSELLG
jgi:hypothetical protein